MEKIYLFFLAVLLINIGCDMRKSPLPLEKSLEQKPLDSSQPALQPWEEEWNRTLIQAKKEGIAVVYVTSGNNPLREALANTFKEKTGVSLAIIAASGGQVSQKILAERRAGLYLGDVYFGGTTTLYNVLIPADAVEPVGPALILPEVLNPQLWLGGELPYTDEAKKLVFTVTVGKGYNVTTNSELVQNDEILSYYDLLDPKWKKKIIMRDFASGLEKHVMWFQYMLMNKALDLDYMKALAKQEPLQTRDNRQISEWVARGKMPVAMFDDTDISKEFIDLGTPIKWIKLKEDILVTGAPRGGSVALMNKAPHAQAAKIFVNWFLSKEGQTILSTKGYVQSRRIDAPTNHLPQDQIVDPKLKYFNYENEKFKRETPKYAQMAREVFQTLTK